MDIKIINGDITKSNCECIVNAANQQLIKGGGVDHAIHMAAGPKLQKECLTLNGCNTGNAKITNGYNLSKYIIHTVGPIWDNYNLYNSLILLDSCYNTTLELSKENNIKTIAFPLISAGVYGCPYLKSFESLFKAIKIYKDSNDFEKIEIYVFDKNQYDTIINTFNI